MLGNIHRLCVRSERSCGMAQGMNLEVQCDKERFWERKMPLCFGAKDSKHLLLSCMEKKKQREPLLYNKRLNINMAQLIGK